MRTKLIVALVIGIIVAVVLLMRGENTHNSATVPGTAEQAKNFPVEVTKPAFEEVERTLDAVGSFFPEDEVTVGSEVDGIIKRLLVDEGSTVKQGDLLLEIDDEKLRLEVEESEAMLREGRARLEHSQATFKRMNSLFDQGVIGQQELDDARNQELMNRAGLENTQAKLSRFKKELGDTRVLAPMDGVVSERMVSAGEYVKIGASLFKIVDANPLKLAFTLPEKNTGEIRTGQKVQVTTRVYAGQMFDGEVYFINPKVEAETRTIEVKARVDNSEYKLRPGYFVDVKILLGRQRSLVLPESAVLVREGSVVVMAVAGGVISYKRVAPGVRFNGKVEILEGITPQDDIVVSGRSEITEGTRVTIVSSPS
jgi:membrane fusion protein (multidrug efflux system)